MYSVSVKCIVEERALAPRTDCIVKEDVEPLYQVFCVSVCMCMCVLCLLDLFLFSGESFNERHPTAVGMFCLAWIQHEMD